MCPIKVSILVVAALIFAVGSSCVVQTNDRIHFDIEPPVNSSEKLITDEREVCHDPENQEYTMHYVYTAAKDYVLHKIHIKDRTPNGSSVIPTIAEGGTEQNFVNVKFVSPDGSAIDFKLVLVSKLIEKPEGLEKL